MLALPAWAGQHRIALVIGNGEYANASSLRNPPNDAADVCSALRGLGFEAYCWQNLRGEADFRSQVEHFVSRLGPDDVSVFYYSGHAVQLNGDNYLIPTEAHLDTPAQLDAEAFHLATLMRELKGAHNPLNLVVLDACRDKPWLGIKGALPGLARVEMVPPGTIVLYATGANEAAYDGNGRNGTLTHHFLKQLPMPGLTIEEMLKRVSIGVQTDTLAQLGRQQTPYVYTSFTGEFCFAGCARKVDTAEIKRQLLEAQQHSEDERRREARAVPPPPL